MVEMSVDTISLLRDILLVVLSGSLGAYLTYVFEIRKTLQERILTQRVSLYRPLVHCLESIIDLSSEDPNFQEKLTQLEINVNKFSRELLLYAPDSVYRKFIEAMSTVKRGAKPTAMIEFILVLRKELMGKTSIITDDVVQVQMK